MKAIRRIEVVEDLTEQSTCRDGFLKVDRLRVRHYFDDGSASDIYPCDIVRRPSPDAVAICLYERQSDGARPLIRVVLKSGVRVPIHLRQFEELAIPDPEPYLVLTELVAGLIEPQDRGARAIEARAARETLEESGYRIESEAVDLIGAGSFASPGISDEKVFFARALVDESDREECLGDGSAMESGTQPIVLDLREALRRCRSGQIPDLKTEVGLYRLADSLGYLPTIDRFVHELPPALRSDHDRLGL